MGVWTKSLQIFNGLCDNGKQSVRRIAQKTGFSKSSVHRLQQAREREQSALRADSENISPFLRDQLVARWMHTCRV